MKHYFCNCCSYSTNHKNKYFRHLNTEKHLLNEQNYGEKYNENESNTKNEDISSLYLLRNPPSSLYLPKSSLYLPKGQKRAADKILLSKSFEKSDSDKIFCQFCEKKFTRIDNLNRHQEKSCRILKIIKSNKQDKINELEEENNKNKLLIQKKNEEEKKLSSQIEKLLDKVGTTHITHNQLIQNNQTIHINNFGEENMEMLTSNFMNKMIKYPYSAIPKMIEKKHFNESYPENNNIKIVNKKDNKVMIMRNNKWEYANKNMTLKKLIDCNNDHMDTYYEQIKGELDDTYKNRFLKYQDKFYSYDKDLLRSINDDTELILWNNME